MDGELENLIKIAKLSREEAETRAEHTADIENMDYSMIINLELFN